MLKDTLKIVVDRYDFFIPLIIEHIYISAIAVTIATVIGLSLGIFISEYKIARTPVLSVTNVIYTIPSIALLGFMLPLTGVGNLTAIITLILYALLPIIRNTFTGITNISNTVIEAADGMGSTKFQLLTRIKLPLAFPVILAGFRNMVVMTIALAGIASFIGAGGLGVAIYRGISTNNTPMILAGSIMIALMAFISDLILGLCIKLIERKKYLELKLITVAIVVIVTISVSYGILSNRAEISIASKPATEQFILTEILKIVIEDRTDIDVKIYKGIGAIGSIHKGLLKGDFDIYPEYTGTAWAYILKKDLNTCVDKNGKTTICDREQMKSELQKTYEDDFKLTWVSYYGFTNSYGIAVKNEIAEKYNLKTYSDLARVSGNLVFGAEYDFYERSDGYYPLVKAYDFSFKDVVDMDLGLKYQAIESGEIDAVLIYTTDGEVSDLDVTILEDDRKFFHDYYAGNVVRKELIKKYPDLLEVLMLLENLLTEEEMSELNYQVDVLKIEDKEVARKFLISKGVLKK